MNVMCHTLVTLISSAIVVSAAFQASAQQATNPAPAAKKITCVEDLPNLEGWEKIKLEARLATHKTANAARKAAGMEQFYKPCLDGKLDPNKAN